MRQGTNFSFTLFCFVFSLPKSRDIKMFEIIFFLLLLIFSIKSLRLVFEKMSYSKAFIRLIGLLFTLALVASIGLGLSAGKLISF